MSEAETEFLLISEAVSQLEAGMFGGAVKRPVPVEAIKKVRPRFSVGWGPHKDKATLTLDRTIMAGDLSISVFARSGTQIGRPLAVPLQVLSRLMKTRGGLPDHAIRPSITLVRDNHATSELFAALSMSAMYVQQSQFKAWYEKQKSRNRWPSQRTSTKPRTGRPSKQTDELRTSIRARLAEGSWSAAAGIAKLALLLAAHGAPKRNTLLRAVNQLYEETGDPRYRIIPRKRTTKKLSAKRSLSLAQNSR